MIFGFSSLGKPETSFEALAALGRSHEFDFVELRALGGTVDLPHYFRTRNSLEESKGGELQCPVRLVGTSLRLTDATDEDVREFVHSARLAERLGACYLRVFGGGQWPHAPDEAAYRNAVRVVGECRRELRRLDAKVIMLLETHDAFSSVAACEGLNQRLDEPLQILWDSHHTWRFAGESPAETWDRLVPLIRHIHYKDSARNDKSIHGFDYVLPGEGEYPTGQLLALLKSKGFEEGVSLEWEKMWHPHLEDLDEALAGFKRLVAPYRRDTNTEGIARGGKQNFGQSPGQFAPWQSSRAPRCSRPGRFGGPA